MKSLKKMLIPLSAFYSKRSSREPENPANKNLTPNADRFLVAVPVSGAILSPFKSINTDNKKTKTMRNFRNFLTALTFAGIGNYCLAQDVHLHVNPRWEECSFQLDQSLTKEAWRQFTREAALVAYFRPLIDAKPMGKKKFEISILKWETAIDDKGPAWNDTFVHPDSVHWLKEGPRLGFPGLTARVGLTDKLDVAAYWTQSFGANYGFWGGQLQYNLLNNTEKNWAVSTRLNFTSMYGPEDLDLKVAGLDAVVSKEFKIHSKHMSVSPYLGGSTFLSWSHEKSDKVNLKDEKLLGFQAMAGAVLKLSVVRLGVEYNLSNISTFSYKVGVAF